MLRQWAARCLICVAPFAGALNLELGPLPPPHSLSTISRFYIYGKPADSAEAAAWLPSFGWGLWDVTYPLHARVVTDGVSLNVNRKDLEKYGASGGTTPGVVWLSVIKSDDFWSEFMPYQNNSHFCCREADVREGLCAKQREIRLPEQLRSKVMIAPIALSASRQMRTDAVFPLEDTGVYYLLLVNCMDRSPGELEEHAAQAEDDNWAARQHGIRGRVIIESTHGFLSGIDVPKLNLYFTLSLGSAAIALWWMLVITKAVDEATGPPARWKPHDFADARMLSPGSGYPPPLGRSAPATGGVSFVHNYLSLTFLLQLLEAVLNYLYYSWENNSSTGASPMVSLLAITSSVLKSVVAFTLVLALALGVYSVHDTMPQYLKVRVWFFSVAFMLAAGTKSLSSQFHSVLHLSPVSIVLFTLPVLLVAGSGCVWIWRALAHTLANVRRYPTTMFQKEVMLCKLRRVAVIAGIFYSASLAAQVWLLLADSENLWKYEYLFTDTTPAVLFLFLTLCVAIIVRPSLQRKQPAATLVRGPPRGENLQIDTVQVVDPRAADGNRVDAGYRTFI